jgi:hypothetical protein
MTTDGYEDRPGKAPGLPFVLRFGEPLAQLDSRDDSRITKVERETTDDD